jgi:CheY-like chemotaxis protein
MADLSRVLVQAGVLSSEDAGRASKAAHGGDVASAALELRLADEAALVRGMARAYECPGIDLSRSAIPVAWLDAAGGAEFCRDHRVLPVNVGRSELALAMANPDDLAAADEVRFLTGKKILRYAAVGTAIVRALDGLESARAAGHPAWRGEDAPAIPDPAGAHAAVVKPSDPIASVELPEADDTMELVGIADVMEPFQSSAPILARKPGSAPAQPPARAAAPPQPPAAAARPAAAPAAPAAAPGDHGTVRLEGLAIGKVALVADDDPEVRQLVATVLSKMGCVVLQAPDGLVALEMVRDAAPDLVVLDAMMPGMHGFEVCRTIKGDRALRATRVVLCSAIYRGTVGTDAQLAFGADAFVEKPFRLDELTRVFKVALVGPAAAETSEERTAREEATPLWRAAAEALTGERPGEASELARRAVAKDPWSAEAHFYLGHSLVKLGQLFEAVAAYERSAELRPDIDASYQCLAQAYEKLGFQKSAREAWTRALETSKDPAKKKVIQARIVKLLGA